MWLIYKSSGSEKKQEAATRSIPEETGATLETADLDGVSSGACVVVDGVDARGIKRMLNEFKEDYKLGGRFHLFSLKVYAQDSRRHLVVFEGGYKFEDFYDLLLTMYLNLNKGQDIKKVKNRVVITFSIIFFGALVIIRLAQIINA